MPRLYEEPREDTGTNYRDSLRDLESIADIATLLTASDTAAIRAGFQPRGPRIVVTHTNRMIRGA